MHQDITTFAKQLNHIGLSHNESLVYAYTLKFPSISIATISRMTHVARSTLYGVVRSLLKKGLLLEHKERGSTQYTAISFQQLTTIVAQAKKEADQRLDRLYAQQESFQAIASSQTNRSIITYYSPAEMKTAIMYSQMSDYNMVRSFRDIEGAMEYYDMDYNQIQQISRSAKVTTNRILYDCHYARKHAADNPDENIRFSDHPALKRSDQFMVGNTVYHGSHDHNHTGIAISDPDHYNIQCAMFDTFRDTLAHTQT